MKSCYALGAVALALMVLATSCARSPDIGKFACTSSEHCPDGYTCTGSPGSPGKCRQKTADIDAPTPADSPITPAVDTAMPVDGAWAERRVEVATPFDTTGDRGAADVPIGIDGNTGGNGGATTVPGTGGAGGGISSATGGASGSGGLGGGGTNVPATVDANLPSTGGAGMGGSTPPLAGAGGATGGNGVGGSRTGGAPGTGGTTTVGTGGTTVVGTGGTVVGTGGTMVGTGGTVVGTGGAAGSGGVTVQLDKTFQTIQGFGISSAMMPGSKSLPIDALFGTSGTDAIGLSILRVGMTPDGSLTGPFVSEAKAKGAKIIGSTWSALANCKSNNSTTDGGYLLESCYGSWSDKIVNFAIAQGLYAMSVASEPDFASCPGNPVCTDSYETMTYTAKQMVAFLNVAGPKLKANGIKVIAPEVSEWIHAWSNASATGSVVSSHPDSSDPLRCGCFSNTPTSAGCAQTCLDGNGYDFGHWLWKDQTAWQAFDIFGVHQYDSHMAYAWPADVNQGKRDKEVWQTETSGTIHWPEQGPTTDINNGVAVAGWIHSALTVGEASAWLWWWYESYYQNDNGGLALIKGGSIIAKRYYTLGNYSKFVRPGYVAVGVAGNSNADVMLSAFKGTNTTVVVAVNKGFTAASVPITITGGTAPASCTPNVTSSADNLRAGTAFAVTGGAFTATLAAISVTTFVCN